MPALCPRNKYLKRLLNVNCRHRLKIGQKIGNSEDLLDKKQGGKWVEILFEGEKMVAYFTLLWPLD